MPKLDILNTALHGRFDRQQVIEWKRPCRPRVLMLVDDLSYQPGAAFGLTRFLEAITVAPGVTTKPALTLAHRATHPLPGTVTIGTDTYTIVNNFDFSKAAPAVTLANYDQIWIFGLKPAPFTLSDPEVAVISDFMNGGGGVFATGDHSALGRALCGSLPRVRHMREWRDEASGGVPMGLEHDVELAINRIDTVVDPGADGIYQFADQSDDIPQRILPNYKVTDTDGAAGPGWSATVHPVLMLPGAPATRTSNVAAPNASFTKDVDVAPDHPHESVCYAVTAAGTLSGSYNLQNQNFPEFQPRASNPSQRVGSEIVAYGVSGGRVVNNGGWKPPVRPRMFGVSSAYDGRLAQAYPGKTQRPGRIFCESTWHHFVNINLDGTGAGTTGLGTGSGASFVPSPDLEKIYGYYRNILAWLQPANRIWCHPFWDLVAVRYSAPLFEELIDVDRLVDWRDLVGLGREARALVSQERGPAIVRDEVVGLLLSDPRTRAAADMIDSDELPRTAIDPDELLDGIYGGVLAEIAKIAPGIADEKLAQSVLGQGPTPHIKRLQDRVVTTLQAGLHHQGVRFEKTVSLLQRMTKQERHAA